jgi:glycosyltransferase involved in cell wall biosynthesis
MRVLLALTYYRPHISGLTVYVERLSKALAEAGHTVTVLTARYDDSLPRQSQSDGVQVIRVPVAARVGKGVLMPAHGRTAGRLIAEHDVVSIHVPQLEAASVALRARLHRRPNVMTYHCDLQLPAGVLNRAADAVVAVSNRICATWTDAVVAYTEDYAESVPLLRRVRDKLEVIPPPVVMPSPSREAVATFRARNGLVRPDGTPLPLIGMASRFASEKGIDVLVAALPALIARFPDLVVAFAGPHEDIVGEEDYRRRLAGPIASLGDRWRFCGPLDPVAEMPAFLGALDCLVLPSVNSTESFGLVQVEAMLCGTAVVASDLPGVRTVVRTTGMGEITPPGDAAALADAVARVLDQPEAYRRRRSTIEREYALGTTVRRYEALFKRLVGGAATWRSEESEEFA